jgi:hypothetical protein
MFLRREMPVVQAQECSQEMGFKGLVCLLQASLSLY